MTLYTQKQLRGMVNDGIAVDVTYTKFGEVAKAIPEPYTQVGYAKGIYGCNGRLFKGLETGKLYAVTGRTQAIYLF